MRTLRGRGFWGEKLEVVGSWERRLPGSEDVHVRWRPSITGDAAFRA